MARLLARYGRGDLADHARARAGGRPVPAPVGGGSAGAERTNGHAEALAAELERRGPTFIKLAQLLSTRADLLPPAYVEALSRLQDDCDPMPFADVTRVVEAELGVALGDVYDDFDPEPLAAASLGQVHRARLRNGRAVAVKVQRPDLETRIDDDLRAIAEIAGLADRHTETGKRFGFGPMVEEFRRSMLGELDYRREAGNLERLGRNLAGFERIVVPQPVRELTTARVLTMDFVGGRKVTSIGALGRLEIDGRALADDLFGAYLKQVLDDGFFHADPHPGNVFVTDDGRLGLLDLGMVARVPADAQDQLVKLLLAVGDGNGGDAAAAVIELAERRDDRPFAEADFVRRVTTLVAEQHDVEVSDLAAGTVVSELSRIAGECGLRPAPQLTMLGKALLNLDEVARALDPTFAPHDAIREQAAAILRRRMLSSMTPGRVFAAALDAKEFAEKLPRRVNKVMDALAEGQLNLNVSGIDEREILRGIHRLANRVTTGLVLAALIIGAAMLMRVETSTRLFGYPALAMICFLLAAGGGFALLVSIVWGDRRR